MSIVEAAVVFESGCFPICHPEDVILTGFEDIERVVCLEIIAIFIDHMRRVIHVFMLKLDFSFVVISATELLMKIR